jgi:hypothetical protein
MIPVRASESLRLLAIVCGLGWSVAFIVVGLGYGLQMYADGSMFSYAVAVQDAWAFHWRDISDRMFVYLFSSLPAEIVVAVTGSAHSGIVAYGVMQFCAPALGLAATYAADRSHGRIIFTTACASTACLGPLVFGFPTEMWMAHSLFWPALALCHYARRGLVGFALIFLTLLALVLTHEGAIVLTLAILVTLALRGLRDAALWRAVGAFVAAIAVWGAVKLTFPPDPYYGGIISRAALIFIDPANLASPIFLVLYAALAGYTVAFLTLRRWNPETASLLAAAIVALALAIYWLWFDHALHTDERYAARTALLIGTPAFGALAAAYALAAENRLRLPIPYLRQLMAALANGVTIRAATGAILVVMLVHAVETGKFVTAWSGYKAAVRRLAIGTASDPSLGDARFVSSARIDPGLNRLSWFSTTPYLSVLLAPGFAPTRLVVDSNGGGYFWLSCRTATDNATAARAIPEYSRRLIQLYSCLHRP